MEVFNVYSLLKVIEPEQRVCIDLCGESSGTGRCVDFLRDLSPKFLNARVSCIWRSVYDKIVIEAEV